MLAQYSRRFHRWLTFIFAIPLAVVVGTGLVLSFEPAVQLARPAQPITLQTIENLLSRHDPARAARAISIRTLDNTLIIGGAGPGGSIVVDLRSGEAISEPQHLAQFFQTARRLHETLLLDLGWLVTASTIALLALAPLGLLLGWPKLRNTIGGWHRLAGWALLPLLVGSPLTGLALAFGISLAGPAAPSAGAPLPLRETLHLVAQRHDVAGLDFVRSMGGGTRLVRVLDETGTTVTYRATTAGLQPMPSNWPRILHEGSWGGVAGSLANLVAAIVLAGLLGTGIWLWARRRMKRRATPRRVRVRPGAAAASG
jgi:uncharacterized iron-regulated membrane protein